MNTQKTAEEIARLIKAIPHQKGCGALNEWREGYCTCGRDAIVQHLQQLESRAQQAEQDRDNMKARVVYCYKNHNDLEQEAERLRKALPKRLKTIAEDLSAMIDDIPSGWSTVSDYSERLFEEVEALEQAALAPQPTEAQEER